MNSNNEPCYTITNNPIIDILQFISISYIIVNNYFDFKYGSLNRTDFDTYFRYLDGEDHYNFNQNNAYLFFLKYLTLIPIIICIFDSIILMRLIGYKCFIKNIMSILSFKKIFKLCTKEGLLTKCNDNINIIVEEKYLKDIEQNSLIFDFLDISDALIDEDYALFYKGNYLLHRDKFCNIKTKNTKIINSSMFKKYLNKRTKKNYIKNLPSFFVSLLLIIFYWIIIPYFSFYNYKINMFESVLNSNFQPNSYPNNFGDPVSIRNDLNYSGNNQNYKEMINNLYKDLLKYADKSLKDSIDYTNTYSLPLYISFFIVTGFLMVIVLWYKVFIKEKDLYIGYMDIKSNINGCIIKVQ